MTDRKRSLAINNGFMLLHGLASVMIGTTLPEMITAFNLSYSQGGLIVSAQGAGGLLIMMAGMVFADRVRKPVVIMVCMIAAGAGFAITGLAPAYWFLVAVFFVTGIVVQLLDTLLNAFTGDIAVSTRTRSVTILHMLYGIGAFVGPTLALWLLTQELAWSHVYFIVGGLYLGAAGVSMIWLKAYVSLSPRPGGHRATVNAGNRGPAPAANQASGPSPSLTAPSAPAGSRRDWGNVTLLGFVILFYAVHQLSTTAWLPLYMESDLGLGAGLASVTLSLYWAGVIVSRLIVSAVAHRLGEMRIMIWGSALGGLVLIFVVLSGIPALGVIGFFVAGLVTGSSIPLAMSIGYGLFPARTGAVTSIVYALMVVGRLIGPWMVGSVGDRLGLASGIMLAAGALLVAAGIAVVVHFRTRPLVTAER